MIITGFLTSISQLPKYIASVSPFIKKSTEQWNFKLGLQALAGQKYGRHQLNFMFILILISVLVLFLHMSAFLPDYQENLKKMNHLKVISENPYLITDGSLFKLPNTSHDLIISTGLKGNTGIGGNYLVSASYSLVNDMLFYSNIVIPDTDFNS